jgi:hypothetical protein
LCACVENDVLHVRRRPADPRKLREDALAVIVVQRVNQREACAIVQQKRMNVPALFLTHP